MKKILFVCIENSCRSQIAEAFAKIHGKGKVEAFSSGSRPSGKVNEKAIFVMKELGYDLSKHNSKSVNEFRNVNFEYVITMGCGDECPFIPAKHREDWKIPDPKNLPEEDLRKLRDIIENKVLDLLKNLTLA